MKTLVELLKENNNFGKGSDILGTDKESQHCYCSEFYDKHFLPYRQLKNNILEIGINTGASIRLWCEAFEESTIYGVDINNRVVSTQSNERVKLFFEDGYTQRFVNKIPNMDIIIDDGPHTLSSQLLGIDLFKNKLNPNGIYVIEDIANITYVNEFKQKIGNLPFVVSDTSKKYNQFDNIIFAFWNKK